MSQVLNKWIMTVAGAALLGVCLPMVAAAGTINVILSDMDVTYLGSAGTNGAIFDAMGGYSGGSLAVGTADNISTAVFEKDGNVVGTLMNDLHGDLKIDGVGATVPLNTFIPTTGANGNSFGFDFFTTGGATKLRVNVNTISLLLSNGVFFFTGQGTVYDQALPYNVQFDTTQPVFFSYVATLPAVGLVSPVGMAVGSGAFTISGTAIPEPATAGLMVLGLILAGCPLARRRRAA
jgi:hypothetical protein